MRLFLYGEIKNYNSKKLPSEKFVNSFVCTKVLSIKFDFGSYICHAGPGQQNGRAQI